jgi:hypothetical protein
MKPENMVNKRNGVSVINFQKSISEWLLYVILSLCGIATAWFVGWIL